MPENEFEEVVKGREHEQPDVRIHARSERNGRTDERTIEQLNE